jgi:hypothetical protein
MEEKRSNRLFEHVVDLLPLALALVGVLLILYVWA